MVRFSGFVSSAKARRVPNKFRIYTHKRLDFIFIIRKAAKLKCSNAWEMCWI